MDHSECIKANCSAEGPGQLATLLPWDIYFLKMQMKRPSHSQAHQVNDLLYSGQSRYPTSTRVGP